MWAHQFRLIFLSDQSLPVVPPLVCGFPHMLMGQIAIFFTRNIVIDETYSIPTFYRIPKTCLKPSASQWPHSMLSDYRKSVFSRFDWVDIPTGYFSAQVLNN